MILKFNILHSDTKEIYLKKRIESHVKRAVKEEKINSYDKAIKFLKKAKKYLNQEFKHPKFKLNSEKMAKIKKSVKRKVKKDKFGYSEFTLNIKRVPVLTLPFYTPLWSKILKN